MRSCLKNQKPKQRHNLAILEEQTKIGFILLVEVFEGEKHSKTITEVIPCLAVAPAGPVCLFWLYSQ